MLIIAHRGASAYAPENTLAAIRLAWDSGADGVEFDLRLTRDGHAVLSHDERTGRMADQDLLIRESTLAELKQLDLGSKKGAAWAGERMPAFSQALDASAPAQAVYAEIKCGPEILPVAQETVRRAGWGPARLRFIGFHPSTLREVKRAFPQYQCQLLVELKPDFTAREIIQVAKLTGVDGVSLGGEDEVTAWLTRSRVEEFKQKGLSVHAWTIDMPEKAAALAAAGVESITTDKPDVIRAGIGKG